MISKRIVVLRGGPSSEFDVSMKTGRAVIDELKEKHEILDCVIDKEGTWYVSGTAVNPRKILFDKDLVFNALHGEYGEDGQVQNILENIGIPFTGPKSFGAKMSMNKYFTKKIYKEHGIKTPIGMVIQRTDDIDNLAINLFRSFPMPIVIKPVDKGSSVGVSIARDYKTLTDTLKSLFVYHDKLLVEEYIEGKEATLGIIQEFRNQDNYSLLPIEIKKPKDRPIFDYDLKYSNLTNQICPGDFSSSEKHDMQEMAKIAHKILNLRHYSRSDFIVHPKRGVYMLETNSLPGLTRDSLLSKGVLAVGSSLPEFLDHIIDLAN